MRSHHIMASMEWVLIVAALVLLVGGVPLLWPKKGVQVTDADLAFLARSFPWLALLTRDQRIIWEGHLREFLARVAFEGCRGFVVDRSMKLLVAAQACLLLAGRPGRTFSRLHTVLLYPAGFRVKTSQEMGPHAWLEGEDDRIGESWEKGTVILSWEDADPALRDPDYAGNLVYHEFAHQLDAENGEDDGVPRLEQGRAEEWRDVMKREFLKLQKADDRGDDTFLDPYGAENPAEFFAVVTEAYFDEGAELKRRHPALYRVLQGYYRLDGERLS